MTDSLLYFFGLIWRQFNIISAAPIGPTIFGEQSNYANYKREHLYDYSTPSFGEKVMQNTSSLMSDGSLKFEVKSYI